MTPDTGDPELAAVRRAIVRGAPGSSDYDLNPGFVLPAGRVLRAAGVLVPLMRTAAGVQVVLTRRSSRLRHHPGQIAFPGGMVDPGDDGAVAAALREASEEIGRPPAGVEVLGTLPAHETVTGFSMTPVVGLIAPGFTAIAEPGEVDEVFCVPLAHLADPGRYRVETRRWLNQQRHYYAVPYGPYYIWGATARILRGLADRMQP